MSRWVWPASRAILSAATLLVAPTFTSCGSSASTAEASGTGGAQGGAAPTPGTGGVSAGGSAGGSSPLSVEAVCDTYAKGRAHAQRTCEPGQVMVHGRLVRDVGEGAAGSEPVQPWSPDEAQQAYQAAFTTCTTDVSDVEEAFGPCAHLFLPVQACLGEALYVCIERRAAQTNFWDTYDCGAPIDRLNQCLAAPL